MTFGWQGFALEHPDDWAPVTLTGERAEGYARIASPGRLSCQVRWKQVPKAPDLDARLRAYLSRLERDAKRGKGQLHHETEKSGDRLMYRYRGAGYGRGTLFYSRTCSRVFFLETVSTKSDSLLAPFRSLIESFRSPDEEDEREPWALFGLQLSLPRGLRVERRDFRAGRTSLVLKGRGVVVRAERWGFGQQLVERHGLEPWARAALAMPRAEVVEEPEGLRFRKPSLLLPLEALVALQEERNQLVAVHTKTRDAKWRPQWDWLN